jgi:hypothetical protein
MGPGAADSNDDSNGASQPLPRTHDSIQPRLDLISRTGRPLRLKSGESRVSIASVATTQAAIQQVFDVLFEGYPSTGRINRDSDCERTI